LQREVHQPKIQTLPPPAFPAGIFRAPPCHPHHGRIGPVSSRGPRLPGLGGSFGGNSQASLAILEGMRARSSLAALSMAYLLAVQPLCGWWAEGHRIVAAIAEQRLNAKAQAAVAAILPAGETLESVSVWADEIRKARRETAPWHYIDIPTDAPRGDWAPYCPAEGCVMRILPQLIATLRDTTAPREKRDEALRFVVHFIGDMHQPLHAGERHDKGGNDVKVTFEGQALNLHAAWDGKLLQAWFKQDPEAELKLRQGAPPEERAALSAGTFDDWIWQSQALARENVYAPLDRCQCSTLDEAYLQQAIPVIRIQILRAGERLGRVLNEALGQ